MSEPLIRDIPMFREMLEDIKNVKMLKQALPIVGPFLKLFGVDISQMDDALAKIADIEKEANEMAQIPDRFNDLFAERGWIIYEHMALDVAKSAISKAEAGDFDGAEAHLVDYYSVETVRSKLVLMRGIKSFRPRMRLAQLALIDYEAGRYHACIPVVLALLDGLVNELHEQHRGFFASNPDLTAWDSMSAHKRGLDKLAKILQTTRKKTRTEEISVPYRHGILHGMDLGYDNKKVAAKTWAALFAVRDWAIKAENDLLKAPPEEPKVSWKQLFRDIVETNAEKHRLAQWQPRTVIVGVDVPSSGEGDEYEEGTPEKALAEYLSYWKKQNYGYMGNYLSRRLEAPDRRIPAQVREVFGTKTLHSFEFIEIRDPAAALTEIETDLVFEEYGRHVEKSIGFRLVYVDDEDRPAVRGQPNCTWSIINWRVY